MKTVVKVIAYSCLTALPIAAEFDPEVLPQELSQRTLQFLQTETAAARSAMANFSDDELQKITNAFRKTLPKAEQRLFWLSEELYRRNAERVAAERIRYLFLAVLAALAIITAFSVATFRRANRLPRAPLTGTDFPAAVAVPPRAQTRLRPERKAAKKRPRGK